MISDQHDNLMAMTAGMEGSSDPAKINQLNVLNVVAFILNAVVVQVISGIGVGGLPSNADISQKYQTIVTPAGWAFSIWGIIYIFQAIFTIAQCLPRFRGTRLVQEGVWYWYIFVCLLQVAWTFTFAFEKMWLSLVLIVSAWLCLVGLVKCQYQIDGENTAAAYWLLRFPFDIHCGWLTAASVVSFNLVAVYEQASAPVQLATGIVSLALLHAVAVFILFSPQRPNYTIAAVQSWAMGAVASELKEAPSSIQETFSSDVILAVRYSAASASILVLMLIVVRLAAACIAGRRKSASMRDEAV